jgi:hypothetical protein
MHTVYGKSTVSPGAHSEECPGRSTQKHNQGRNEGKEMENQLRGANDRPGRRATACKKGAHGGEVEAEPGLTLTR